MASLEGDLLILGAGGKMGPSLARLARRSCERAGIRKRIIAVARFTNSSLRSRTGRGWHRDHHLRPSRSGCAGTSARHPKCHLYGGKKIRDLRRSAPDLGDEHVPSRTRRRALPNSRIVAFSTGNVYPLRSISQGGAKETTPVDPVGEYAQSALGRERMFEYASAQWGTRVVLLRLNYAVELRYGVLVDIGLAVFERPSR